MDVSSPFSNLSPQVREKLRPLVRTRQFDAGEVIFLQDEPTQAIYIVGQGRVKITRTTPDGEESILCIRKAGEYFCPVPLLDGKGQLGTASAITPVTILCIERNAFLQLCQEHPELLAVVQADCLGEVRYLLHRLETTTHRTLRERVVVALLDALHSSKEVENNHGVVLLTHQELAGLSGVSRENTSRVLKELEREGLLKLQRGKIHILDIARLRRMLEPTFYRR
ncbi:MAG: Crp/Fnr family transcriptional regulator [Anaerolineales bacterium]